MTSAATKQRLPLRLTLGTSLGRQTLDGAWWPQSQDFAVEFADLAAHMPDDAGRVSRVNYQSAGWTVGPRRIDVGNGRMLRAAASPGPDRHQILLGLDNGRVLQLLVVPLDFSDDAAERLMQTAADAENRLGSIALVTDAVANGTA